MPIDTVPMAATALVTLSSVTLALPVVMFSVPAVIAALWVMALPVSEVISDRVPAPTLIVPLIASRPPVLMVTLPAVTGPSPSGRPSPAR